MPPKQSLTSKPVLMALLSIFLRGDGSHRKPAAPEFHTHPPASHSHMHAHSCTGLFTRRHTHEHAHTCTYIGTETHLIHRCTHLHAHIFTHGHTYTSQVHTHVHTHIHKQTAWHSTSTQGLPARAKGVTLKLLPWPRLVQGTPAVMQTCVPKRACSGPLSGLARVVTHTYSTLSLSPHSSSNLHPPPTTSQQSKQRHRGCQSGTL